VAVFDHHCTLTTIVFDHYGTRHEWRRLQTFTDWPLVAP
jgi:hypothetical protein